MGIHRKSGRKSGNLEIWKSGNLEIWKSGSGCQKIWIGWPATRSRFFAKSQKVGLEKIWTR
jgi:hypothetical protein